MSDLCYLGKTRINQQVLHVLNYTSICIKEIYCFYQKMCMEYCQQTVQTKIILSIQCYPYFSVSFALKERQF